MTQFDPDDLVAESRRFFALTDGEQDAECESSIAKAEADGDIEHIRI